jgi:hypothetical protein
VTRRRLAVREALDASHDVVIHAGARLGRKQQRRTQRIHAGDHRAAVIQPVRGGTHGGRLVARKFEIVRRRAERGLGLPPRGGGASRRRRSAA